MIERNYITIQGWQVKSLHLAGSELLAFALIYGFCQAKNKAKLSINYIAEWLGNSPRATSDTLKRLEKKGLIKTEKKQGEPTSYQINEDAINKAMETPEETSYPTPEETSGVPLKKIHTPHEETSPSSNIYNNSYNENITKQEIEEIKKAFGW